MFVLDDLLLRPFVSLLDVIHAMAVQEMYDVETIRDDIKENQLLYELGERTTEEYEQRKEELNAELKYAQRMREKLRRKPVEVRS